MAQTATVRVLFLGDAGSALRSTNLLSRSFAGLGRTARLAGVAITAGIVTSMVSATSAAIGFDRAMRNVNSIAKLSEDALGDLSKQVLALAKESGQAPQTLAEGLYDVVSSGFAARDAIVVLRASAKAATAGLTDTKTAAKAVSAALNAYHLPARKAADVSDVLFETVNRGVLSFEELAQNMGDLVPAAAPLGVTLEEVGAAIATITLQGVPAAEAATRVKNVMLQLASPSEELTDLLEKQGFASGEAAIEAEGFVGVLELLDKATDGNVTATSKLTPEIRALMGAVGLTGKNLRTYKDNLEAMEDANRGAGATAEAFAEQGKSISVQWDKAKAGLTAAAIGLATSWFPAVEQAVGLASDFAGWLQRLSEQDTVEAKLRFTVAGAGGLASQLKDLFLGAPGKRIRVPIDQKHFEWQLVGQRQGILSQIGDQLEHVFSEEEMFGDAGRRVRVPVEGGRFEWQLVGVKEGWLAALERELEGGVEEIDFGRVGQVLARTGSGLIQVAGVLSVALARLIGKAIRDINWGEVGMEIAQGMRKALQTGLADVGDEAEKTLEDKLGGIDLDLSGFKTTARETPIIGGMIRLGEILDAIDEDAEAATGAIEGTAGQVNKLGSQLDKLPLKLHLLITDDIPAAISRVEEYRFALNRIPSQKFVTITTIETRRAEVLSGTSRPGRAFGGPVRMGEAYTVGERGREVFVPHRSGRIDPVSMSSTAGRSVVIQLDRAETRAFLEGRAVAAEPRISRVQGRRADLRSRTLSGR
jgi:TP901 family phage tail tape measure protein